MIDKIKFLLTSLRFWQITLGSASAYTSYVVASGFSWVSLLNAITIWLGVVAGTGTIDGIAERLSGNKK